MAELHKLHLDHHPTMDVIRCLLEANESVHCRKVADLKLFIGLVNNQNLPNGVIQAGLNPF